MSLNDFAIRYDNMKNFRITLNKQKITTTMTCTNYSGLYLEGNSNYNEIKSSDCLQWSSLKLTRSKMFTRSSEFEIEM